MGSEKHKDEKPSTGLFRSEKMLLVNLLLQPTIVFDATAELGAAGIIEFRELNPSQNAFQRTYVDEVRRTEEIERKLQYFLNEIRKESQVELKKLSIEPVVPRYREIIRLESNIEELERNLRDVNKHLETLLVKRLELLEFNHVLEKTFRIVDFARSSSFSANAAQAYESDPNQSAAAEFQRTTGSDKLNTITGVIDAEKASSFHRMLWRICSNNALVQFYDIQEPIEDHQSGDLVSKKVFLVMCQGETLFGKIRKIAQAFHANCFDVPSDSVQYKQVSTYVSTNLKDINMVIDQTQKQRIRLLVASADAEHVPTWRIQIAKLKSTFATMNLFKKTERGFVAEGWVSESDFEKFEQKINHCIQRSGVAGQAVVEIVKTDVEPPTYFRTNKFTKGFQNIVDSYGIATYREMNPAPYAAITFPFLFAVMFADAGHGLIMLAFALWMVLYERRLATASTNEIWLTFFEGRYIILLMGAFSIYTGIIYNDIFAKSANLFGTSFEIPIEPIKSSNGTLTFPKEFFLSKTDSVYPYGIDSVWQLSQNKILFLNSFKMKLSVTLGVLQMFFGVCLSYLNHIQFRDRLSIICEFIPQLLFLLCLFGYMIGLIFSKWLMVWEPAANAPSILIDFINMFLMKYPDDVQYLKPWFTNKKAIQTSLLAVALLSVPFMLLVKPTIIIKSKKSHKNHEDEESAGEGEHHGESAMDIYIHQAIHTIEYCLGSISHTASYLRLWALSLAHSQLSEVLWSMVLKIGLTINMSSKFHNDSARFVVQGLVLCFTFAAWATLTVSILIVMEGLSAFLHALRLHWVEFMSKFYKGNGYLFKPFDFKEVVAELENK